MKRRFTLSTALVLNIVFLTLMSSDSANAQLPQRYVADTGIMTLGPGQILRVTVNAPQGGYCGDSICESLSINFQKISYRVTCNSAGECLYLGSGETNSAPVTLTAGEGASVDITPTRSSSAVRIVVSSNSRDLQLNTLIIDGATGAVAAHNRCLGDCWVFGVELPR